MDLGTEESKNNYSDIENVDDLDEYISSNENVSLFSDSNDVDSVEDLVELEKEDTDFVGREVPVFFSDAKDLGELTDEDLPEGEEAGEDARNMLMSVNCLWFDVETKERIEEPEDK